MGSSPIYSFIIPAYNAEKTIKRAIDSISSRMKNYEVIVVENGSIDDTTVIVERLSAENGRIRLLHSEKGVSRARNAGIENIEGDWIIFVDADDEWVCEESDISRLTSNHVQADIIACSYYKDGVPLVYGDKDIDMLIEDDQVTNTVSWFMKKPTQRMTAWAKLYRRDFIAENGLTFNEELRISEDSEFLIRCLIKCNRMAISNLPIYKYCTDTTSTIRSIDETRTEEYLNSLSVVRKEIKGSDHITEEAYLDYVIAQLNLICVHDIFNCEMRESWNNRIKKTKSVIEKDIMQDAINRVDIKKLSNIDYFPIFFFKHRMDNLGGIMCYTKSLSNRRAQQKNRV